MAINVPGTYDTMSQLGISFWGWAIPDMAMAHQWLCSATIVAETVTHTYLQL
jgi:hypothetical protein